MFLSALNRLDPQGGVPARGPFGRAARAAARRRAAAGGRRGRLHGDARAADGLPGLRPLPGAQALGRGAAEAP